MSPDADGDRRCPIAAEQHEIGLIILGFGEAIARAWVKFRAHTDLILPIDAISQTKALMDACEWMTVTHSNNEIASSGSASVTRSSNSVPSNFLRSASRRLAT